MLPAFLETDDSNQRQVNDYREVPTFSPLAALTKRQTAYFAEWPYRANTTHFIIRSAVLDGRVFDVLIDMSFKKFTKAYAAWVGGVHIQNAFPNLSCEMREFIMTGLTPTEWDKIMADDEPEVSDEQV